MGIFDDPRKNLQRLQEELLTEEEDSWEETDDEELDLEELNELLEEDLEECFEEDDEAEAAEPLYRNHANGYGSQIKNYANSYGRGSQKTFDEPEYDDEEPEEDAVLYKSDYKKAKRKQAGKNLGLIILIILELIAIGAVGLWWLSWL